MSPTIHLVTDRPVFEHSWRDALTASGLVSRSMHPNALATDVAAGRVFVIDGAATGYDEDELLTAVGLARAVGAVCAVSLPDGNGFSGIEDLLEDMCPGLVVRNGTDIQRLAGTLGRRADATRPRRFEYLTVSPRANELLALLGDGTVVLVPRPVAEDDDGSEVSSIELGADAQTATLKLGSGHALTLRAGAVCDSNKDGGDHADHFGNGNGANGVGAVDGARLGARLRELRLAAGLTQAELARRTGIHRPNIARVEAGRHTPSLETLARLASAIGVPTTVVLSGK